jgi:hypothetical protein
MRFYLAAFLMAGALATVTGCGNDSDGPKGAGGQGGAGGAGGGAAAPTVGITACAEKFLGQDDLCHPSAAACAAGTIPDFANGCRAVGIPSCAKPFADGEDGVCHVTMAACPAGTFAVPSEGCVPIDGAEGCGDAPWGSIADAPGTIYVDPAAAAGGAGTKEKPAATIAEALGLVADGGRIALAAGTYAEPVQLHKPIEIVGRCPSMVKISGVAPFGSKPAVVGIDAQGTVSLRRLQIGGDGIGVRAHSGDVLLDHVWIHEAQNVGLVASFAGTKVELDHSLIQGTRAVLDGTGGQGIVLVGGAALTSESSALVENRVTGAYAVEQGTALTLHDSLIEGTASQSSDKYYGNAVYAGGGAQVTIAGSAFVANRTQAIDARDAGTVMSLSDSVIEKTQPTEAVNHYGSGVFTGGGAELSLSGTVVSENHGSGVQIDGAETKAKLTASLIRGTLPSADNGTLGYGIGADQGATLTLDGTAVLSNHHHGLVLGKGGTSATITASLFEGTKAQQSDGRQGEGALLLEGATASFTATAFVGNTGAGLWMRPGASATVQDSLVEATAAGSKGENGVGIIAYDAKLQVTSTAILDSRAAGVLAAGTEGKIEDSVVRKVSEGSLDPWGLLGALKALDGLGDGILILDAPDASTLDVTGSRVEGSARAGVLFAGGGELHRTAIQGNRFGVVVQSGVKPILSEDNQITGNTEKDLVEDGALPVP